MDAVTQARKYGETVFLDAAKVEAMQGRSIGKLGNQASEGALERLMFFADWVLFQMIFGKKKRGKGRWRTLQGL